jgi:hypothetical protein
VHHLSQARWLIWHLLSSRLGMTALSIAQEWGTHHSTVLHGFKRHRELVQSCPDYRRTVTDAIRRLPGPVDDAAPVTTPALVISIDPPASALVSLRASFWVVP